MELLKPSLKELTDAIKESVIIKGQRAGKARNQIHMELIKEVMVLQNKLV